MARLSQVGVYRPSRKAEFTESQPFNYDSTFNFSDKQKDLKSKRADKAKLSKLGSLRSSSILDSQGGSAIIDDLRARQKEALKNKDSELYDELTQALKNQMQIEASEAEADPFGKMQIQRDAAQTRKDASERNSDPRVVALRETLDDSFMQGQELLSGAINATPEQRSELRKQYNLILKENLKADRQLTALRVPGHGKKATLSSWMKGLGSMAEQLNVEDLSAAKLGMFEGLKEKLASEVKGLDVKRATESERLKELKSSRDRQAHNQITRVLKDSGLSEPSTYDSIIKDAAFAVDQKNIFTAVKLLSNVIEPGLSVTEGEVQGYTVGGTSAFNKFVQKYIGANENDLNRILTLLKGIAENRREQAQNIVDNEGRRVSPKKSTTPKKTIKTFTANDIKKYFK